MDRLIGQTRGRLQLRRFHEDLDVGVPLGDVVDVVVGQHLRDNVHLRVLALAATKCLQLNDKVLLLLTAEVGHHGSGRLAVHPMAGLAY